VVDYFNGVNNTETDFFDQIVGKTPVPIGDLILAEVLQGFRDDTDFEIARRVLEKFIRVEMVSSSLALQSARNYRLLRRKGIPVRKMIDSLITTYCIENEHDLLHNDSGFDGYEKHFGLSVIHP
jgi:predicted nucleic acid-binding protein